MRLIQYRFAVYLQLHFRRHLRHVLVAAAAQVHDDELVPAHLRRALHDFGDGVGASSAGMIPSSRASFMNASSAASSLM